MGVGESRGKRVLYEVIIHRPGLTHAAASSGSLLLDGNNEAGSLRNLEELAQVTASGLDTEALQENLRNTTIATSGSRSNDDEAPLILRGNLTLFGDAISGGSIEQDGDIQFLHGGRPLSNSKKVELPVIDNIQNYDPQVAALGGFTELSPSYNGASNLFLGRNRLEGDLNITGDVQLSGAILYVTGDVNIQGNITGDGAIVSLGNTTLTGQSTLEADSKVAVISQGDLRLEGTGAERSLFSGLVYSEGKITAEQITVVGGLVANNPTTPQDATLSVIDSKIINLPEKTKFDVRGEVAAPKILTPGANFDLALRRNDLTLIQPDLSLLLKPDGTHNGVEPVFGFQDDTTGIVYASLAEVPGLEATGALSDLEDRVAIYTNDFTIFLQGLEATQSDESIFQLDPNQLLTISQGFRVVWRRNLDG